MSTTLWENEKRTVDIIIEEIRKNGEMQDVVANNMKDVTDTTFNSRQMQRADTFVYKNSKGEQIELRENINVAEIHCNYGEDNLNRVIIIYDKIREQYYYYVGIRCELARVSKKDSDFLFFNSEGEMESLPESEKEPTALATIEKNISNHPALRREYQDILNAYKHILSIDSDRQVQPLTPLEVENAKLKDEIKRIKDEEQTRAHRLIDSHNAEEEKAKDLEKENASLKEQNAKLQDENTEQKKRIEKLQAMLGRTLEFAGKVRDSVAGKLFFKKQLNELNIDGNSLPEGTSKDETDSGR